MRRILGLTAVFAIVPASAALRAADASSAASAWQTRKWAGDVILPMGHYRGPGKEVHIEKDCRVTVGPGTLLERAKFGGGGSKWRVEGSLFREVELWGDLGLRFEAKDAAFDDCYFHKGGGFWVSLWSTRWHLENCVFSRRFLPGRWGVVDYAVRATDCTFHDLTLSSISYKDDPAKLAQSENLRFERCRFTRCEIPESALASTVDCVFDSCRFNTRDRPDWSKAGKPIVVNAFLAPSQTRPPTSYSEGRLQVNFRPVVPTQRAGATLRVAIKAGRLDYPAIPGSARASVIGEQEPSVVAQAAPPARAPAASPAPQPVAPSEAVVASYVGRWQVRYSDQSTRTYQIGIRGDVAYLERNLHGQVSRSPDGLVLDFGDGQLERLDFKGETLSVQRFESKAAFPGQAPSLFGLGAPVRDVAAQEPPLPGGSSTAARLAAAGRARHNEARLAAGQRYLRDLTTALQAAMSAGDLDDANAIKADMDRVRNGGPSVLKFKSAFAQTAQSRYGQALELASMAFVRELEAAQKAAMNAGNLDEANGIHTVRKHVEQQQGARRSPNAE